MPYTLRRYLATAAAKAIIVTAIAISIGVPLVATLAGWLPVLAALSGGYLLAVGIALPAFPLADIVAARILGYRK